MAPVSWAASVQPGVPMGLIGKIVRTGKVAEKSADRDPSAPDAIERLHGSLQLRHVDVGSCNGCEIEISGCFSPVYDAERYGVRLVASPRHADGLLVTGVVTQNMSRALQETLDAVPAPALVIAVGDCAVSGGIFLDSYAVRGQLSDLVDVDFEIPGCPPDPSQIIGVLRCVTGR